MVTTRLHGLVTALKLGVPAVAIDAVRGGGKVSAQARALGWPYVAGVDDLDVDGLAASLRSCLQPEAVRLAVRCRDAAAADVDRLAAEFMALLGARQQTQG